MKNNKFEFLSKRKNEVIIILGVTGLIVLGAIGYAFGFNSDKDINITSNGVEVAEKAETEEKKEEENKEVKVNNEEESKKESEELKNTDTSKTSEKEKKDAEGSRTNEEEKDNSTTYSNEAYSSTTYSDTTPSGTSDSSSEETNTSESEKSAYEKESEEMARAFPSVSTRIMRDEDFGNPRSIYKERTHSHTWVDVTETITHAEEGHWEEVVVTPESIKEVPVYETKASEICNGCGADITGNMDAHIKTQMSAGNMACSGFTTKYIEVQTGTKQEATPAVTEKKWVVDKPSWTETAVVGKKCSGCGAIEYENLYD